MVVSSILSCHFFRAKYFFYVGPPKEDIFLTTFYGLYFSSMLHMLQISILASEGSFPYYKQQAARRSAMRMATRYFYL